MGVRLALALLLGCGAGEGAGEVQPPGGRAGEPAAGEAPSAPEADFATRTADAMATTVSVALPADRVDLAEVVFEVFAEVEASSNEWREDSPLGQVNAGAGGPPVEVPTEVLALVERGRALGATTDGAFDITWAALWGLWDFRAESPRVPEAAAVEAAVARVDHRRVEVDAERSTVRLPEAGMKIGLGGIAKGWALDEAARRLRARGAVDFHIVAGGQVLAAGRRGGRPWRVGIRDPRGARDEVWAAVLVSDRSVSTSGDYERWFLRDGVRYHHILDPRTGWPARGVRSATVIAESATDADALSTALVVLGVPRALELVGALPGVEAVMIDDSGRVHRTPDAPLETFQAPRP